MIDYLDMMADTNMNALLFQVRPAGDAFYASNLEPWSRSPLSYNNNYNNNNGYNNNFYY